MHGNLEGVAAAIGPEPLIPMSSPLGRGWYAVYTAIKSEFRVKMGLEALGFGVFLPCETRCKFVHGRRRRVHRPLFSRYVFVAFDPDREQWSHPIRSTDGVETILENNRVPVRIPSRVIEDLQRAEANGAFDKDKLPAPGERFIIAGGPFADMVGKVKSARPSGRVKLLLSFLGKDVPAEFALADLQRIS